MRQVRRPMVALLLSAVMVIAGCSSSSKSSGAAGSSSGGGSGSSSGSFQPSTALGSGVTPTTIKIGVALVDFTCIQQFVDQIRQNQDQVYQAYFNYVNANGGVAGRKIVPVYQTYCPIGSTAPLAVCTQFTEDAHVFAVMGTFEDFSGDAQTCVAKNHNTVLQTFDLNQSEINQSPPGMIICACVTPERTDSVLISLMQKNHVLAGKKIAILGETKSASVVTGAIEPGLKGIKADLGSTAILNITGADTSAAQAQLDSFIEKWKSEGVNALYISGTEVNSEQFVAKVRQQMPGLTIVTDESNDLMYGQEIKAAGVKVNPYDGVIIANGPTTQEYNAGPHWARCAAIYKQETGKPAPDGETVIPGPNGKTLDLYGNINDACQLVLMFQEIGNRVGKYLNNTNWVHAIDTYGEITDWGSGPYAALFTGHYDDEDSFRLESYDSTIGAKGDWKALTPLQDIRG
jgi:ABC-type branched-subunit amino acid transport system substrate-binding protein